MAPQPSPGDSEVRVLNETRQRLQQLTAGLASLQANLVQSDPLPPWSAVQKQASIISGNLDSVSSHLDSNQDLLSSMTAYPLPNFPGHTQQGLLNQLLRTKVEPGVEDWLEKGRNNGRSSFGADQDALTADELRELWTWAPDHAKDIALGEKIGLNYTQAERERGIDNVVTGLQKKLEDDVDELEGDEDEDEDAADEEEEEEEDEMQVVGVHPKPHGSGVEYDVSKASDHTPSKAVSKAMPIEDIFRFMMTATVPAGGSGA